MWASLCSFLYEKFFPKKEINPPPLSKSHSNNCFYGKRLKLSNSVSDKKCPFSTTPKYSMQGKENYLHANDGNYNDNDDDECCIIAEFKRKKPTCSTRTHNKFESKNINFRPVNLASSIVGNSHLEEDNEDIKIVKCVKNIPYSDRCFKPDNKKFKFFTTPRTHLSVSKAAKSKMVQKNLLRKKINCLQESYRLTEKLKYIQLLQSHTSSNFLKMKASQPTLRFTREIPVIDLTEEKGIFNFRGTTRSYSASSVSSESSSKSDDPDMQIIKEIPKVNLYEEVLKSTSVNVKDVIKEIFLKQPEKNKLQPYEEPECDDAINLLDEIVCRKTCPEELEVKLQTLMHITEPQTEQKKEDTEFSLPELSVAQEKKIQNALVKEPREEALAQGFGLIITRSDMHTLKGLNWLNDEIINFYMNLIMERSEQNQSLPKVYSFNTFFYPQLVSKGYSSVRRWTKKVNIFSFDILFVPIHLGMHWCLSVIDFRFKSIKYYDSIGSINDFCLEHLLSYLKSESRDKLNKPLSDAPWLKENVEDIPQQMNGSDCGVFSCMFAEHLARDTPFKFTQDHMVYFRKKMVLEILERKLIT